MFFVTGDYSVNFITADQLRIELKAGGLNQQQENHVISHILKSTQAWEVSAKKRTIMIQGQLFKYFLVRFSSTVKDMSVCCDHIELFYWWPWVILTPCRWREKERER